MLDGAASFLDLGGHKLVATAETTDVAESSGVIASRLTPDVYWTHNDSGSPARVYAFRLNPADRERRVAKDLGYVELTHARNDDWEDIAYGPSGMIYLLDGGDNTPCHRSDKRICRFREPRVELNGPAARRAVECESIRFEYADAARPDLPATRNEDRYDAEAFFVHPRTGDMYLVTKRGGKGVPRALVYKISARGLTWNSEAQHVASFVADLTLAIPAMATGADIDDSGRRVIIRDYLSAYEFTLPPDRPFDTIFTARPGAARLLGEPQGEGICYSRDGRELITTSEVGIVRKRQFTVYATPAPWTVPAATRPATGPAQQKSTGRE